LPDNDAIIKMVEVEENEPYWFVKCNRFYTSWYHCIIQWSQPREPHVAR